jgi:SAM-dependent methyltransferase
MGANRPERGCDAPQKSSRPPLAPSAFIKKQARKIISHLNGPIADLACGSGRNVIPFLQTGLPIFCYDINASHLDFVRKSFANFTVSTQRVDLISPRFTLPENHFSLLILVHFYNRTAFQKMLHSIKAGGFLVFESIAARGGNYLELPGQGEIISMLRKDFRMLEYVHKDVEPLRRETVKLLARKQ